MTTIRVVLVEASWDHVDGVEDASLLRLFANHECSHKGAMMVSLGEENACSRAIGEDIGTAVEIIRDADAIREFLSCHQVMQLPALVELYSGEATATVLYPPSRTSDAPDTLNAGGGGDDLFQRAMDAYEQFDIVASAKLFTEVLRIDPMRASAYFNMAGILHMCEYPTLAMHFIEQFLLLSPEDTTAKSFLWSLASSDSGKAAGIAVYRRLMAAVHDPVSSHRLAQLTGETCSEADNAYLKDFYDRIAENFENKLVVHLGYRGPWILYDMVYRALTRASPEEARMTTDSISPLGRFRIFDLGCGTGLCGRVFGRLCDSTVDAGALSQPSVSVDEMLQSLALTRGDSGSTQDTEVLSQDSRVAIEDFADAIPSSGPMFAGIDISSKMIDLASDPSNNYSLLTCGHLVEGLGAFSSEKEGLDIVLAADTFIYVGALSKVFGLVSKSLKSRGLLAFSTELLDPSDSTDMTPAGDVKEAEEEEDRCGYKLLESARFGHSVVYVRGLCEKHSFDIILCEKKDLRTESSVPLPGMFYVLRRN